MASLNKVILIGNLTRDPEVRFTPKGTAVTDLGLAVNRVYSTDSGEKREEVTFVDITVWGKQAESAGQWLSKGKAVFIEGRLQMDEWQDKTTGQNRTRLKVVADGWQFVGPKTDGPSQGGGGGYQQSTPQSGGGGSGGGGYQQKPPSDESMREPVGGNGGGGGGSGPMHVEEEDDDIPF